jgi:hypothetical protein
MWILTERSVDVWSGFVGLRTGSSGGWLCADDSNQWRTVCTEDRQFGCYARGEIASLFEGLSDSLLRIPLRINSSLT